MTIGSSKTSRKHCLSYTIIAALFSVILIFGSSGISLPLQPQNKEVYATSQGAVPLPQGAPLAPVCNPNSPTLQFRSVGAKVVELQRDLTILGYGSLLGQTGIDGKFGSSTQNAVKKFQQDNRLPANGIVGPTIWRALCTLLASAQSAPPQKIPSQDCDPTKSEIVYPSKVYKKGIWQFLYGVYKGQGLFVRHLSANSNPLLDILSIPHFKIDYGGGNSKIIRFCNDQTIEPRIFSEVNPAGKKYDRLAWAFERVINEPDLKGVLHINYDIIIRTDPVTNCEPGENICYRLIPMTSFTWEGTGMPATPEKLDKFSAFYRLDYGDNSGLVVFRDRNWNVGNAYQIGERSFESKEIKFRAVDNGRQGVFDNFHNAHLGQSVFLPGCRETAGDCLHVHWRWGDMTPTIDPLVDTITDRSVGDSKEGEPYLVPGQTIDVAVVRYYPQETYSIDPLRLVNGELIGTTKTREFQGAIGDPPTFSYSLESSYHPVVWYIASVSNTNHNEFFRNGMFVLDRTK
jgi:hypothetical protein